MKTVLSTLVASPAAALEAYELQRQGAVEAILTGHAAKMGGAETIDAIATKTIRAGLKKMKASDDASEALMAKFEKNPSNFLQRGRVWFHVLFVEPGALPLVEGATVALRTELGHAMAGTGSYKIDGYVHPETMGAAREAVQTRVANRIEYAAENDKPIKPELKSLAGQVGVTVPRNVKTEKASAVKVSNGNQARATLNKLAGHVAVTTAAPASWVEEALADGTALAVRFKTAAQREAFTVALDAAMKASAPSAK